MNQDTLATENAEIERRFADAGVVLPMERRKGAIESAKAMLAVTHWLRQPRSAANEPSNTFSLAPRTGK